MNEWGVEVATDAISYKKLIEQLQGAGYQITMVQFVNGEWVVTHIKGERKELAS